MPKEGWLYKKRSKVTRVRQQGKYIPSEGRCLRDIMVIKPLAGGNTVHLAAGDVLCGLVRS